MIKRLFQLLLLSTLIICTAARSPAPAKCGIELTLEEREYIANAGVLKAVSIDGLAPLQYLDKKGEVRGIAWRVMEEISALTGLAFEYQLYNSTKEVGESDGDLFFTATKAYTPFDMIMSKVFMKTETILFMNSKVDSRNLNNEIYAGVRGGALPEGVRPETRVDYDTREGTLDAVEAGEAGYGYGNAYSVAYYTLRNNYTNIITVPTGKDTREFHIGLKDDDPVLLSIINKALDAIDDMYMQNLILDVTSHIERKVTLKAVIEAYGLRLLLTAALLIGVLLYSVVFNTRAKNRLMISNRKYELLSRISNEYLYEYILAKDELVLSDVLGQRLDMAGSGEIILAALKVKFHEDEESEQRVINLPLASGATGVFKSVASVVHDNSGRAHSVIGKLMDISQEHKEKEKLISKSEIDGLTGVYNATTAKRLFAEQILNRDEFETDALVMLDLDRFKSINDTLGHPVGDRVLRSAGTIMRRVFRKTDVIGRVGGDEFCVYIKNIPNLYFIHDKAKRLNRLFQKCLGDVPFTASVGIALIQEYTPFEDAYARADKALYRAKDKGQGQIMVDCG